MIRLLSLCLLAAACAAPTPSIIRSSDATIPAQRDGWHMTRHLAQKEIAANGSWKILFIGDSITQSWENAGAPIWEEHYGGRYVLNLGISGDRTQHVLWRIGDGVLDGLSPQQVVLMIGTNNSGTNTSREIADGVESIVRELKSRLLFADIIVLGIFPRGAQQHDPLRQVNIGANRLISQRMALDERVHFFDIGHVFVDGNKNLSTAIMPDLLHLSEDGYRRWAEALAPLLGNQVGFSTRN